MAGLVEVLHLDSSQESGPIRMLSPLLMTPRDQSGQTLSSRKGRTFPMDLGIGNSGCSRSSQQLARPSAGAGL